jgi:UDP-glucose 4-epimerase
MPFVAQVAVGQREFLNVWGNDYATPDGTGVGYSVLDMVRAFEQVSGRPVPYKVAPRRAGDIAACYADPTLARQLLGWQATRTLADMCADAWRWQSSNPRGYAGAA